MVEVLRYPKENVTISIVLTLISIRMGEYFRQIKVKKIEINDRMKTYEFTCTTPTVTCVQIFLLQQLRSMNVDTITKLAGGVPEILAKWNSLVLRILIIWVGKLAPEIYKIMSQNDFKRH